MKINKISSQKIKKTPETNVSNNNVTDTFRHDLKNPLTVMKCYLELISMELGSNSKDLTTKKYIQLIDGQIEKMVKMLSKNS